MRGGWGGWGGGGGGNPKGGWLSWLQVCRVQDAGDSGWGSLGFVHCGTGRSFERKYMTRPLGFSEAASPASLGLTDRLFAS